MVTSNLVFSAWDRIFKNPMTAMQRPSIGSCLEFVRDDSLREEEARRHND
jgi:hypothetical protein